MHTVESVFNNFKGLTFFSEQYLIEAVVLFLGCSDHVARSWIILLRLNGLLHVRPDRMTFIKF